MFLSLLAGCEDEFLTGASITRMRLLAGKVIIDGDSERAWLRSGDSGRFDFTVAFADPAREMPARPNRLRDVKSMVINCTKGLSINGQPQCAEVLALAQVPDEEPDAGADAGPAVSPEQIEATVAALRAGIDCGDPDDNERPFKLAQLAIGNVPVTTMSARLECPHDEIGNPLRQLFDVPAEYRSLEAGTKLGLSTVPDRLVQGVICEYGEPIFKSEAPFFGCRYEVGSDPALPNRAPTAEVFFYSMGVEGDGVTNNHPKFGDVPLRIRDAQSTVQPREWVSEATIPDDCAGVTDPELVRDFGAKSTIRITTEAMREIASTLPDKREVYQVEGYSTFGELERQFSVLDDLDTEPFVDVEWDHGKRPREGNVQVGGKRVDFYFVIRDGRFGTAIETRSFCLCAGKRCPDAPTP